MTIRDTIEKVAHETREQASRLIFDLNDHGGLPGRLLSEQGWIDLDVYEDADEVLQSYKEDHGIAYKKVGSGPHCCVYRFAGEVRSLIQMIDESWVGGDRELLGMYVGDIALGQPPEPVYRTNPDISFWVQTLVYGNAARFPRMEQIEGNTEDQVSGLEERVQELDLPEGSVVTMVLHLQGTESSSIGNVWTWEVKRDSDGVKRLATPLGRLA